MSVKTPKRPKYQQIRESLAATFHSGDRQVGSQLPPQSDLAKLYNASLLTVRQALGLLERDGLIERIHGKGTFIRNPEIQRSNLAKKTSVAYVQVECPRLSKSYQQTELRSLDQILAGQGRHLVLATLTTQNLVEGYLPPALKDDSVAGILLEHNVEDTYVEFLKHHGFPLVVMGNYPLTAAVAQLRFNQGKAAYLMSRALLSAKPGQPLHFITEPFRLHYTQALYEGYCQACQEANQEPRLHTVNDQIHEADLVVRRIIKESAHPFSLLIHANIAHGLKTTFDENQLPLSQYPVAIYGAADYVPPSVRRLFNQCTVDTTVGCSGALRLLDDIIAGNQVRTVEIEPTLKTTFDEGRIQMDLTWSCP